MDETRSREQRPAETTSSGSAPVTFELRGLRAGFVLGFPVALGVGGYGLAFGILADQAGLSVTEAALMSATVFAGAAQLVAVELWADPIPVLTVVAAVTLVNLRYALLGAALQPWLRHLTGPQAYGSLLLMADENWALTQADLQSGSGRGAFLLGSGIALWLAWVAATIIGAVAGDLIGRPAAFGLDFVLVAVFVALAVGLWDGRQSVAPWGVSLLVALPTAQLLGGRWYILAGGLAAAIVAVMRHD